MQCAAYAQIRRWAAAGRGALPTSGSIRHHSLKQPDQQIQPGPQIGQVTGDVLHSWYWSQKAVYCSRVATAVAPVAAIGMLVQHVLHIDKGKVGWKAAPAE